MGDWLLWEEGWVDVETAVFGGMEKSRWDEETEGDGNDEVDILAVWSGHLGFMSVNMVSEEKVG